VKNGHMQRLGKWAILLALPCLLFYAILRLDTESGFVRTLKALDVDPIMLSSFMMLWVGCFLGVVISYGSRTTTMNLNDLINTDADRLLPQLRLVFAGTLTMVLGVFLVLGVMELKIGSMSTEHIGSNPMLAFLIGALCGISELVLPGTVTKKASDLLGLK
jgi:hypothetical protein